MYKYSKRSFENLMSSDTELIKLFTEVIKHRNCSIVCGHRGEEDQNKAFKDRNSKLEWPNSKHNKTPSRAVDVWFYPLDPDHDWEDKEKWIAFRNFVYGVAAVKGIKLNKTIPWDQPHYELRG